MEQLWSEITHKRDTPVLQRNNRYQGQQIRQTYDLKMNLLGQANGLFSPTFWSKEAKLMPPGSKGPYSMRGN